VRSPKLSLIDLDMANAADRIFESKRGMTGSIAITVTGRGFVDASTTAWARAREY
jgi:hypothetical protein